MNQINNKVATFFFLLLVVLPSLKAQTDFVEGYIVKITGDTLLGHLDQRLDFYNYQSCVFKEPGQKENEYFPQDLLAFGYKNGKHFVSQIKEDFFVEAIITGKMSLFRDSKGFFVTKEDELIDLVVEKKEVTIDNMPYMKDVSRWKNYLAYLAADCDLNLYVYLEEMDYSKNDLVNFVKRYNQCVLADVVEYNVSEPLFTMDYGFAIDVSGSFLKSNSDYNTYHVFNTNYSSINPGFGFLAEVYAPRLSKNFSFQSELLFSTFHFFRTHQTEAPNKGTHYVEMNFSSISLPLSLKYKISYARKFNWFFQGGIAMQKVINQNTVSEGVHMYSDYVFNYDNLQFKPVRDITTLYWTAAGFSYQWNNNFQTEVSLKYTYMRNLGKLLYYRNNKLQINNFSLRIVLMKK